jgi:hypothetical protein
MSEERRARRRNVWLAVKSENLREGIALTHDASPHGVLMVTASTLEVGAEVSLELRLPSPPGGARHLRGRVVRVERNEADPHGLWPYRMAVEIEPAAPELGPMLAAIESMFA